MGRERKQIPEVPVGARRQWAADRALRPPMRSPGRPEPSRAVQRDFWRLIASGVTTAEAAQAVGVSWPVGSRWFRQAGGMPPISLDEATLRRTVFRWAHRYNTRRRHSHCGNVSPNDFEVSRASMLAAAA
ncbi:hypothetical protein GCM10028793_61350 [Nocardiopsis oceani]